MNLKKPLGFISEKYKDPSVCESCGEEFICGVTIKGCWCMDLTLTEETRKGLKKQFDRCLCKTCLEELSVKKS